MTFDVQSMNFGQSDALYDYAVKSLGAALDRFDKRVDHVTVRLTDENGPRGGKDMKCRLVVALHRFGTVVIDQEDMDPYNAIDRAAERAKRTVRRTINRRRDSRRSH